MTAPIPYLRGAMLRDLQRDLLDQRRVIRISLRAIHPLRNRPALEIIVARWLSGFRHPPPRLATA